VWPQYFNPALKLRELRGGYLHALVRKTGMNIIRPWPVGAGASELILAAQSARVWQYDRFNLATRLTHMTREEFLRSAAAGYNRIPVAR
jgi:hypothetical protein